MHDDKSFKLKVLTVYHDESTVFSDSVLIPINAGRALVDPLSEKGQWLHKNTIGDDSGENISLKNKTYNEMTAIYWAWKNQDKLGNPDAIGVQHYRRHFVLNESLELDKDKNFWEFRFPGFTDNIEQYFKKIGYSEASITQLSSAYPCVAAAFEHHKTVYQQYLDAEKVGAHHIEDLDFVGEYISNKFPEYKNAVSNYFSGCTIYVANMFLMHKNIFNRYCAFIFDVLKAYEEYLSQNSYLRSDEECRFFVSERITGIFITKLIEEGVPVKKLAISFVECPNQYKAPTFENDAINIAFATNEKYLKYLSVAISSMAEKLSVDKKYNAYIMHTGISPEIQKEFLESFFRPSNLKVNFLDIRPLWSNVSLNNLVVWGHISIETYYRFLIQKAFPNFNRILYLDSDLLVLADIAELYHTDLKGKPFGAALDIRENFASKVLPYSADRRCWPEYLKNELNIAPVGQYFQAGVMIFDLKSMAHFDLLKRGLDRLEKIKNPWLLDQCVLNAEFSTEIAYFNTSWNVEWQIPFEFPNYKKEMPKFLYDMYKPALESPKIIHYASPVKPWNDMRRPYALKWWSAARKTGYYEILLQECLMRNPASTKKQRKIKQKMKRMWHKFF